MTQFKPILTVSGKRGRPLISRLLPLFFQVVTLPFKTRILIWVIYTGQVFADVNILSGCCSGNLMFVLFVACDVVRHQTVFSWWKFMIRDKIRDDIANQITQPVNLIQPDDFYLDFKVAFHGSFLLQSLGFLDSSILPQFPWFSRDSMGSNKILWVYIDDGGPWFLAIRN